jgi:colicin import membrane protein
METTLVRNDHFSDLRIQLNEYKKVNETVVFEYETPKGEKEARSHVAKLRKMKKPISERHKQAKAEALEECRRVDSEKNLLISDVEEMITFHNEPLEEIKKRREEEAEREIFEADFEKAIADNILYDKIKEDERKEQLAMEEARRKIEKDQEELRLKLEEAERKALEAQRIIDDERLKKEAIAKVEREKEAVELALIREREASELAKVEAEKKRLADAFLAEKKSEMAKRDAEVAEKNRLAYIQLAKERAEVEAKKAVEAEKNRIAEIEAEKERVRLEAEQIENARKANAEHQTNINRSLMTAFLSHGITAVKAKSLLTAIIKGEINNISVNY